MKSLRVLCLDGVGVSDAGVSGLIAHGALEELYLQDTNVTDGAVESIGMLPRLKCLSLARTAVSDSGIVYLHGSRSLEYLALSGPLLRTRPFQPCSACRP